MLHAGQPSVNILGVGDVLFGRDVPAGRMVQTFYPVSFANQVSIVDMNMRPGPSAYPRPDCPAPFRSCAMGTNPGRTHRFYTGTPVVKFGWGLSYTTWKYSVASSSSGTVSLAPLRRILATKQSRGGMIRAAHVAAAGAAVDIKVEVTNTGDIDADDSVLGFLVPPGAGKGGVPLQTLYGFERVHVRAGQTVTVSIPAQYTDFSVVARDGGRAALSGAWTARFGVPAPGMGHAEYTVDAV